MIPFFNTEEGLTSTSANYVANQAKNYYESLEEYLNNIRFYKTTLKIIGNIDGDVIKYSNYDFDKIEQAIKDIASAKSLIAWLREAIKAKDNLTNNINNISFPDYLKLKNIECNQPQIEPTITEEEYLNSLSIKDRQRYYALQTYASTIGQVVHKGGNLNNARKSLIAAIQNPIETHANGRDTLIYTKVYDCDPEDVNRLFFKLQSKQREYQAEFNNMKYQMEQAIEKDRAQKSADYQVKFSEYSTKLESYRAEYRDYIVSQLKEVQSLKIVIPNNLKEIYEKIKTLGK